MMPTVDSTRNDSPADHDGTPARRWRGGVERRWWTLIAVCGATFMLLVDITIVFSGRGPRAVQRYTSL
jgi:hypothetical protein